MDVSRLWSRWRIEFPSQGWFGWSDRLCCSGEVDAIVRYDLIRWNTMSCDESAEATEKSFSGRLTAQLERYDIWKCTAIFFLRGGEGLANAYLLNYSRRGRKRLWSSHTRLARLVVPSLGISKMNKWLLGSAFSLRYPTVMIHQTLTVIDMQRSIDNVYTAAVL